MHLSTYRADGAYPAPCLTIASGLAHVCTAGNRRAFLSAAVRTSRVAGSGQRIISWGAQQERFYQLGIERASRAAPLERRHPRRTETNPAPATPVGRGPPSIPDTEIPASFHAIGSLLLHTDLVRVGERTRCVIVDDNRDFLDAASRLLEHQGISVVAVATSSAEGLQRVIELRPDVMLVDIDLGEESGFDVVEQLHRNGSSAAVPTILISTHAEEDFAELVAASPALAFIPKSALSGPAIRDVLGLAG